MANKFYSTFFFSLTVDNTRDKNKGDKGRHKEKQWTKNDNLRGSKKILLQKERNRLHGGFKLKNNSFD